MADAQDRHDHHDRDQAGNGHIPVLLNRVRAVDGRRLEERFVHGHQRRVVIQAARADNLPAVYDGQDRRPVARLAVPLDALAAKGRDDAVQYAVGGTQNRVHNERNDDDRQKAQQKDDRVIHLERPPRAQMIEKKRHQHAQYQIQHEEHRAVHQRVADGAQRVLRLEEKFKVFKADPLAAQQPLQRDVFFEGDDDAAHRHIAEQNQKKQPRQCQQKQRHIFLEQPVALERPLPPLIFLQTQRVRIIHGSFISS